MRRRPDTLLNKVLLGGESPYFRTCSDVARASLATESPTPARVRALSTYISQVLAGLRPCSEELERHLFAAIESLDLSPAEELDVLSSLREAIRDGRERRRRGRPHAELSPIRGLLDCRAAEVFLPEYALFYRRWHKNPLRRALADFIVTRLRDWKMGDETPLLTAHVSTVQSAVSWLLRLADSLNEQGVAVGFDSETQSDRLKFVLSLVQSGALRFSKIPAHFCSLPILVVEQEGSTRALLSYGHGATFEFPENHLSYLPIRQKPISQTIIGSEALRSRVLKVL